jgi:hypothetical protein
MVPGEARKFAQYLTEQKELQTQREQQWNAIWKAEYLEHAPGKPLTPAVDRRLLPDAPKCCDTSAVSLIT